jgi:hypothetical protein
LKSICADLEIGHAEFWKISDASFHTQTPMDHYNSLVNGQNEKLVLAKIGRRTMP